MHRAQTDSLGGASAWGAGFRMKSRANKGNMPMSCHGAGGIVSKKAAAPQIQAALRPLFRANLVVHQPKTSAKPMLTISNGISRFLCLYPRTMNPPLNQLRDGGSVVEYTLGWVLPAILDA